MTRFQTMTADPWREPGEATAMWVATAVLLLVGGVLGFLVHPLLGVGVLALLVAPVFVVAPRYGLLVLVAMLPFDAVLALEDEGSVSLTRLVGLAVLGGWLLHVIIERRPIRLTRGAWLLVGYAAFAVLSLGWAADKGVTVSSLARLLQLVLLTVMAANVLRTPADVRRTMDVLLASTLVVAVLVLVQMAPGAKRATFTFLGETVNPNYLAATLVFPAVAAVGFGAARGPLGWWRLAAAGPIALAVVLTGSRGGGIAMLAGLVTIGLLRRRRGIGIAAAGVALAVLLPAIVPQTTVDRLWSRYATAEQDRLSGRMDIWRVALAMAEERPVQGVAYGGFNGAFYRYMIVTDVDPRFARLHNRGNRASHNIYVGTLAELGIVGLALLVCAIAAHGRALWQAGKAAARRGDLATTTLAVALLGVFMSFVFFGTTIDLLITKAPWLWLAMMQAEARLALPPRAA